MSRARCRKMSLLSVVVLACLWNADSVARAPHLYARTAYQSPVRGDPDDLLVLAGDALSADVIAVYQAYTSEIPEHPKEVPSDSSPLSILSDHLQTLIERNFIIRHSRIIDQARLLQLDGIVN